MTSEIQTIESTEIEIIKPSPITQEQIDEIMRLDEAFSEQTARAFEETAEASLTGHDLGTKLIEVKKACPSGTFTTVLQSMGIKPERAEAAMRIASGFKRSELEARKADALRQFALTFTVPAKETIDQQGNAVVRLNATHRKWVNDFSAWVTKAGAGLMRVNPDEVKKDTLPLYEYLKVLHGEANGPRRDANGKFAKRENAQ